MMLNRALSNAYLFPLAESKLLSHDMMSENRRLFINQIFLQRLWHANFRVWIIINVREREHGIFILTSCNRNCADSRKTFPRSFGNANVVSIEVTESTRLKRRITHTLRKQSAMWYIELETVKRQEWKLHQCKFTGRRVVGWVGRSSNGYPAVHSSRHRQLKRLGGDERVRVCTDPGDREKVFTKKRSVDDYVWVPARRDICRFLLIILQYTTEYCTYVLWNWESIYSFCSASDEILWRLALREHLPLVRVRICTGLH